jgi:hypothetical protein
MRSWILAMYTVTNGISFLEALGKRRWTNVLEVAVGQYAIPNSRLWTKFFAMKQP